MSEYGSSVDTVAYGSRLAGWARSEGIDNPDLVNYFMSPRVDAETKHMFARMYRSMEQAKRGAAGAEGHGDEHMHLVPYMEPDGSFYYVNRNTGNVVASMHKMPNGLFSYYGDKKMMEMLGGRGLLNQMNKDASDSDFFHDHQGSQRH